MARRIAIVEDDPAILANYADAFRKHGYEVAAYGTRAEADTALASRLPDLALLDIGLGDEPDGGFTLCRELRARSPTLPTWARRPTKRRRRQHPFGIGAGSMLA